MSESLVIHSHHPQAKLRASWRSLLLAALLGAVVGGLGVAIAATSVDVVGAALTRHAAVAPPRPLDHPDRELPREWKTWEIGVKTDHMVRRAPAQRNDWIRNSGRR